MNADSAFTIGTTHSICQDYAIAVNDGTTSYAIISDGCSTSKNTDIGARLLVQAAVQIISSEHKQAVDTLPIAASRRALQWAQHIGLSLPSIDATLLIAYSDGDDLIISASGDGVIVLETAAGGMETFAISYPSGFPFYPAYSHQPERLGSWRSNECAHKEIQHFLNGSSETNKSSFDTEVFRLKASDFKHATIISDGVYSFYRAQETQTSKQLNAIPMQQILTEIVSFKGGTGSFVARRLQKLKRALSARQTHHFDDLAIGAIHLG